MDKKSKEISQALRAQHDQLHKVGHSATQNGALLNELDDLNSTNAEDLDNLLSLADNLLAEHGLSEDDSENYELTETDLAMVELSADELAHIKNKNQAKNILDQITISDDWESYMENVESYAKSNNVDISESSFCKLLPPQQKAELQKRIEEEYTLKKATCDKYEYMIAATSGVIGGLIDAVFVGAPGKGALGKLVDHQSEKVVTKFAGMVGWKGPKGESSSFQSAISYLERKYKVNYDHRHTADVLDGLNKWGGDRPFQMSARDHHLKSLGHAPDLIGLVFSILDQFTNSAHFMDGGKVIKINTETFEMRGETLIAKIFCGFMNWLGHLFSDFAGSNGSASQGTRGSGIPIPFYSLLQSLDFGSFTDSKKTIAEIATELFRKSYDFRHGIAMSIPVIVTELLIRTMWTIKRHYYNKESWKEALPSGKIPELRRMLLVGHGCLCLVDVTHAAITAIKPGVGQIEMLLQMNLIAWVRFGYLALKEIRAQFNKKGLDIAAIDEDLDKEMEELYAEAKKTAGEY